MYDGGPGEGGGGQRACILQMNRNWFAFLMIYSLSALSHASTNKLLGYKSQWASLPPRKALATDE